MDSFFNSKLCIERLYAEWVKHPKLIIASDFDDTIYDFHQRGQNHTEVLELLMKCKELGFYVVLFSASKPERFDFMRKYCSELGLEIDGINKNVIELPYGNNGKIYYNILLDDRAGLFEAVSTLTAVIAKIESSQKAA